MNARVVNARVVRSAERHTQTGQTSGMVREEAFHSDQAWAGVAHNAPKAFSGWHHHGEYESVIYVLSGRVRSSAARAAAPCSTPVRATSC